MQFVTLSFMLISIYARTVNGVSLKEILNLKYNQNSAGHDASVYEDFQNSSYERNERLYLEYQKNLKSGKIGKLDSDLWHGLDGSKNPGIIFLDSYKGPQNILSSLSITDLSKASPFEAELAYFSMVESIHVLCRKMKRFGNRGDGGWDVCLSPPYNLKPGCLIYSFGINFDFSFDDSIGAENNCLVKSFDPSMSDPDHVRSKNVHFYQLGLGPINTVTTSRWVIKSLSTVRRLLRHSDQVIDVLKFDIEFDEWDSLLVMIQDKSLLSVKQLIFEAHTPAVFRTEDKHPVKSYLKLFKILSALETKAMFRKYHFHPNPDGVFMSEYSGNFLTCCYELYYINISFLKSSS